jgi:hypothetical protein
MADPPRELTSYADECAGGKAEPERISGKELLLLADELLQRCVSLRLYVNAAKLASSASSSSA